LFIIGEGGDILAFIMKNSNGNSPPCHDSGNPVQYSGSNDNQYATQPMGKMHHSHKATLIQKHNAGRARGGRGSVRDRIHLVVIPQ
jgi:hypothetical protein